MKESLTSAQFHLSLPGPNPTSELLLGRIWGTLSFWGVWCFHGGVGLMHVGFMQQVVRSRCCWVGVSAPGSVVGPFC